MKNITFEEAQQYIKDEGCVLLSKKIDKIKDKIQIIGRCGHIINATFKDFRRGHYRNCKSCASKRAMVKCRRTHTLDEIKKIVESKGYVLLDDEYIPGRKIHIKAQCGHDKYIDLKKIKFLNYGVCYRCKLKRDAEKYIKDEGCELLSDYINSTKKIKIKCRCGHTSETTFNGFKSYHNKRYCEKCSSFRMTEVSIFNLLKNKYPSCVYQKTIKSINFQYIDFFIPELNLAIEYNGEQHYKWCRFFHKKIEDFYNLQRLDRLKKDWCDKNNIRLLIIDGRKWKLKLIETKSFDDALTFGIKNDRISSI